MEVMVTLDRTPIPGKAWHGLNVRMAKAPALNDELRKEFKG